MPIKVPNNLPAAQILMKEQIFIMPEERAIHQDIRELRIAILNLMPLKQQTEVQLLKLIANSPLQVEVTLLAISSYEAKNTSKEYLLTFYKTFDEVKDQKFDGVIITGAPVEMMEFEDVAYWPELCRIMEWTKTHVCLLYTSAVYLELSRDISDIFLARHRQMEVLVQLTGVILSLSAILIWLLSYFLTRPIRKLSIGTREIARGDYAKRVLVRGHNEVSELAQDFNRMAQAVEEKILSLEEAAHRQEEFTANFAHELKTPLTSIIGYADMLRSSPLSQEEQLVCANYIFGEGKRLEALSFKLLDLFVLRRGDFSKRRVEAEWLLQSVCNIYRPAGDQAGVVLRVSAQEAALHVEPDLIKTLLLNLVDNARKASQPEQTITIEGRVSGGRYRVEVRDEGRGMEETELGRIQEPFYMVDKSRARQQHGAGLGLSLCREIARFHDTDLSFWSQVGKGTRVWLELEIDVGEEPGEYEG